MFNSETVALLESGCALTVGTVSADGTPHASRGWGLTVLPGGEQIRLLLDADDGEAFANLVCGGSIAVTGCSVPTLHSVQLKGQSCAPVATSDEGDLACAARFCASFIEDVTRTDGTPAALLERLIPTAYAVCTVTVSEVYDQTPGPVAGSPLKEGS